MEFNSFKSLIPKLSVNPLGGIESQFKLAPKIRKRLTAELIQAHNPKPAAVLALFYPNINNQTHILLTKRANYKGTHAAQISFPGGKVDTNDINLQATALREAHEEVGINITNIQVFKEMTPVYIPPSNFLVNPYLAYTQETPIFKKNHEVATIIEVSLVDFLNEASISIENVSTSYASKIDTPCFKLNGYVVWGATAMMLSEIKDLFLKL
ncbi:CoA pyrophosphatase [Lutibacter sp. HS1-25]|nr:CoA pyrophosphatase [Lutibacter sp. HS1-25]RXP52343.1 CoA pyrophosphatase [Lutibacter sp. HS1-25]